MLQGVKISGMSALPWQKTVENTEKTFWQLGPFIQEYFQNLHFLFYMLISISNGIYQVPVEWSLPQQIPLQRGHLFSKDTK
jgi:hypothetical protein